MNEFGKIMADQLVEFMNLHKDEEPVYKGCLAASHGGCMCSGACKEIIG